MSQPMPDDFDAAATISPPSPAELGTPMQPFRNPAAAKAAAQSQATFTRGVAGSTQAMGYHILGNTAVQAPGGGGGGGAGGLPVADLSGAANAMSELAQQASKQRRQGSSPQRTPQFRKGAQGKGGAPKPAGGKPAGGAGAGEAGAAEAGAAEGGSLLEGLL